MQDTAKGEDISGSDGNELEMNVAGLGSGLMLGPELAGKNFLELVLPQPIQIYQEIMELGQMKRNSFRNKKFSVAIEPVSELFQSETFPCFLLKWMF